MTKTNDFISDLKVTICERLNDYEGVNSYGCNLAYTLFEGENANGSVFCNTYKTKEFIKENFDLFGDLLEDWSANTGEQLDPFNEPEKCHVILLLESASHLLGECKTIEKTWNNSVTLTPAFIKKVAKEVNDWSGDLF